MRVGTLGMVDDGLRSTEVDGVPVFWVPASGPLTASLWFRAGMVDETLPTRGWLHLLEHMALHDRDTIRAPVNGQVSLLHTSFDIQGQPDDVAAFLREVCRWLAAPVFAELEHERRILRAEGMTRGTSTVGDHLLWRYGAQGPGLAGYDELGLHTAHAEGLRGLAAEFFTRGNAALALTGPPPRGLGLPLPPGGRRAAPRAAPCDQPTPAGFIGRPGAVAISGTVQRSTAAAAMSRALQRVLQRSLRDDSGMGYSAWSSYETVDADHTHMTTGIDVLPEALTTVVAETTAVLRRLRDRGPDATELRDDVEQQIRRITSEPAENWQPFMAVREVLLGRPIQTADMLVAELSALTVADIQTEAAAMWRDLLISTDPDSAGDPQLTWLVGHPEPRAVVTGRKFRSADSPVTKDVLTIGRSGASLESKTVVASAMYDDLAAVIAYPDGGRRLVRHDGYQVVIEPELWRRGREAIALVDQAVPATLQVLLPERAAEEIPRNSTTKRQRLAASLNRPAPVIATLIVLGAALLATDQLIVVFTDARFLALGIAAAVGGLVAHLLQRRAREPR